MQSPDQVSVIAVPVKTEKVAIEYCIALYDYDASAEDELTFEENQIITIVNKSPHGVDDGWWEGEYFNSNNNTILLCNVSIQIIFGFQVKSMEKLVIFHH